MEDLKQALRDFVATSNSGKYQDEATLLSKFPELSGYNAQVLRDFVATSNSGQYASEEELFSKFPEFSQPVKKKEESSVPLWLQKQEQPKPKPEPTLPFLESKPSGISLGSQRVPETAPMFEAPPMRTPEEAQAIVETPEYKETPYFTGTFGQLLRNMESPWNPAAWVADKIDDFGRAVGQGASTGDVIGPTSKIFLNGDKVSDKTIEDFRKASEMAERLGPSDEMVSFSNQYQESGKTTAGFLKALAMNPGAIPEIMVSSYTAMVNAPSLQAAGGVISTSAAGGAVVGGPAGAGAAALASIPYAMAAMGATLETNASLAESIKEKLAKNGLEWTDENIKAVISDKDFLNDARVKAATRGLAIGAIDALTGRIAGKVGAKLLKSPKAGVAKSAAAAGSIEAIGGSVGEATARGLTGEEMDVAEIGLEGIAELPGTVVSVGAEVLKTPVYKINGEIRPESDVQGIINTATGDDLSKINIEIINDKKGYKQQIQDKVVSSQVRTEVRDVNPELPEETIDEIVSLEMERKKFEGKKTQSAKDKLASINSQIKTLQENAVQKPSTKEGVLRPEESQVGLPEVGEGDAKEQAPAEEVVQEEVEKVSDALKNPSGTYVYNGEVGNIVLDGQTVVLETPTKIIEIGNIDDLSDANLDEFGIAKEEELDIAVNEDNSVTIKGETYQNNYSDPLASINKDKDGNYSVTLDTKNGQKRTFRGQRAQEIAYQYQLKQFEQNAEQQIDTAEQLADEAIATEREIESTSVKRKDKSVRKANRKTKQRTLKSVKPVGLREEVLPTEEVAVDEGVQAAFDRLEIPEDVETLPGIDDELNKINESIGRVKEEGNTRDDERTLVDLGDKIARAKRNVASAEDTEAAIDELRQAQKERDDFEQSIEKRKNFNTVDALISEEIYQKDRDKETYEYQELFDQDPRLAALQSAKDMAEFAKENNRGDDRVKTYENNIKILEEDIAKFPVNKAEIVSPATPTLSEESQKIKTQLEDFRDTFDEAYNAEYPTSGTAQQKRSAIAKSKKAIKKLQQMMGFDIGVYWELDADQTKKREALYSLRENKDYDSYDEMVAAYQKDVADGNQSKLVESVNTLLGIAPSKPKVSSKTPKAKSVPIPVAIPKPTLPPATQEDIDKLSESLENVDAKKLGVIDYNAKRLSLEERGKEDKPIVKDNTPIGSIAQNEMGDAYELQVIDIDKLTPNEKNQNLDLVEKYVDWKRKGNDFPPITALRKSDGTLLIVDGHNRYRAAKLNGDKNIRVWVGLNEGNAPMPISKAISESYYKAKSDGSNPKLVKQVDKIIEDSTAKPATPVVKEQAVATPKVAKTKAVAPVKEEVAPVKEAEPAPKPVAAEEKFKKLKTIKDIEEDPRVDSIYKQRDDEGVSWWIELKDGYEWAPNSQIIHEYTVNELLSVMNNDVQAVVKPTPVSVATTQPSTSVKESAPAPKPVAVVSQPTPRIQGPEALRQEYIDKIAEVRLNKDKSRTPKQIEERVAELRAEYQKLKAEMTAPKPKAKVEVKAEAKPKTEAKPSRKDETIARDIKRLESDIDTTERKIQSIEEDIEIEKGNIKELLEEIRKKRNELKGKKMPKAEREEANEQIKADIIDANNEHDGLIEEYQNDIAAEKADLKKYQKELAKLKAKQAEPVSVVEEEEPSYDDIKDLDVSDPTFLEIVEGFLDDMDDGLSEFGRGNLSSGMAIPLAKAIIKSLKVLVKAGITLQEAIKRVAAENNLEAKDIVNMIKELDSAQSPMVKLKAQVQNEIQAVKDGVRNANEAVQAIVKYFNFNAERGNLTRRDLGRVINVIAKVKDQKSLNKAADKIFEIIDKAKTDVVEVSESKALVSQIKLEARAALNAKKDVNQKRKDLSNVIKAMETTGRISAAKARAILNKIGKVNLDNPASVDAFLDYVENVFEDAAYEVELAGINAKIARAKKNINKKIGTASKLTPILNRLFSIKPSLIPAEAFDAYKDLIDMFGASDAVLALDEINSVTDQVQLILDQVDDQLSSVPDLAELLFNYNKAVLNEDGSLNYAETIKKMKEDEVIDDKQYELMQKYKSYILPKTMKVPQTKQEIEAEKAELISQVNKASVDISALATDDEKKMASDLVKLAKSNAASRLTNRQLANLLRVFDNINNGYLPNYANTLFVDLEAAKNSSFLSKAIAKAKMPTLAKVASKLRLAKSQRESVFGRIKNLPLFNIDEVFGDFKTKDIFNSVFNALAQSQQRYILEIEKVSKKLDNAFDKVAASFKNNPNKLVESKMKLAIYRIQREFESNPGDPRVNAAIEYINETVKAINNGDTMYSDEDAKLLEQIAKDYSDANGGIDAKKLYNSFNSAEKEALDVFDEINKSLEKYAVFTGDVIRGDKVYLLNNYNHLNVLPKKNENPDTIGDAIKKFDTKGVVSTKAKSLIERTQGAKAINFDIFSTMQRGANYVLMDYHLTNPVRVARRTISSTRQLMEEQGTLTQEKNNVLNAISDSVELALKAMLDSSMVKDTFADMVVKELAKTGYRAMLAGIPRATTELTSNMAYVAMVGFSEFKTGLNLWDKLVSGDAVNIMEAVGSKVISRIYGSDPLGGRLIDTSVLSKKTGIGESSLKGGFRNLINTIHNNSTKKVKNAVELTADTLVSTPDKIMMRPLWFGSFSNAFKDITGVQPDFEKIAARDVDYMIKYQDAMDSAGKVADEKVTMAGNVDNPFMNSLRSYVPSDVSALTKSFKIFNNFMNKFMIGEFLTARRGALAMVGNGNISKTEGAKLMAAVVARMTVYSVMLSMVSQFFYGLFLDDEDEDDEKSFAQKLGQGLASTLTSLLLGRDFGNAMRSVVNYGIEKVNEKYLDFLRDGEYDPYEDAIQYTFIPPEKKGKSLEAFDVLANVSGPYAPSLKSMAFITKKLTETPKKEGDAIERQEQERNIRIPLEVLGNLGYLPLYKDVRSIVNKSIYSELDKEMDKKGESKEEFKPMGLNKTDLKRYYPEIYEQYYGEGTEEDAKRKLEYEKNRLEREMKDEYYQYVPKQRSKAGFGGKGFGTGTGKKSGGFGSKGFGK